MDASSKCPHVAFNQGIHAWMSSIAPSRTAVTSGEKLPLSACFFVLALRLCATVPWSKSGNTLSKASQLRTSTSCCPGVYWHSEHETTAGSVTDYWHRASHRENMFSHGVLTRQTVIHNTILSDPAHKKSPKPPAVVRTWSCFVCYLVCGTLDLWSLFFFIRTDQTLSS